MNLYNDLMNSFLREYYCALEYEKQQSIVVSQNELIDFKYTEKFKKIGYIVATCSPVTKAHIELANKAISDMSLDVLYFIVWPFYYIKGFHSENMLNWVKEQKLVDWKDRVELLKIAIEENDNKKIEILYQSKEWYKESEKYFNINIVESYFWTGSWYIIRKLQTILNINDTGGG